jgi:hypothetical protein
MTSWEPTHVNAPENGLWRHEAHASASGALLVRFWRALSRFVALRRA